MRRLSEAAERALRHRQWHWCRRPNGFCAKAKWAVAAERLGLPIFQVVAFANWLEELANEAETRGHLGSFSAAECGRTLGMATDDAARIYAALEEPDIGWIAYDHVADFFDRNPDREDPTVNERKRRSRAKTDVLKKLALLAGRGEIDPTRRLQIEVRLTTMADGDLFAVQAELARKLSTVSTVTRDARSVTCDIVTVTPEQSRQFSPGAVDNFGGGASGQAAGLSKDSASGEPVDPQIAAGLWLLSEGKKIVAERMAEPPADAERRILRWRDQQLGGDAAALAEVIRQADATDYIVARFHNLVVDGIRRARTAAEPQRELPIPPVLASERKMAQ